MTKHWSPLAVVYLVLAVVGLIATWTYNIISIVERRDYLGEIFAGGPSVQSFTWDLLIVAVAGSVFIIVEARRLGMRLGWLYVVGSAFTAFAFTFPLFLSNRQRRLNALRASDSEADAATAPRASSAADASMEST